MRHMSIALAFLAVITIGTHNAHAQSYRNLGLGLGTDHVFGGNAVEDDLEHVTLHLRALNHIPFEAYGEYYFAYGVGTGLKLHLLHFDHFSIHVLDPGAYFPLGRPVFLRNDIKRGADFVVGGGIDIFFWKGLMLSCSARWMFPDPVRVISDTSSGKYDSVALQKAAMQNIPEDVPKDPNALVEKRIDDQLDIFEARRRFVEEVYKDFGRAVHLTIDLRWYW